MLLVLWLEVWRQGVHGVPLKALGPSSSLTGSRVARNLWCPWLVLHCSGLCPRGHVASPCVCAPVSLCGLRTRTPAVGFEAHPNAA